MTRKYVHKTGGVPGDAALWLLGLVVVDAGAARVGGAPRGELPTERAAHLHWVF